MNKSKFNTFAKSNESAYGVMGEHFFSRTVRWGIKSPTTEEKGQSNDDWANLSLAYVSKFVCVCVMGEEGAN